MADPSRIEAFFAQTDEGYILYPHRWAKGIRITADERARIIEAYRNRFASDNAGCGIAVLSVFLIAAFLAIIFGDFSQPVVGVIFVVAVMAFVFRQRMRRRKIFGLVLDRAPTNPRRGSRDFDIALGKVYGHRTVLFLLIVFAANTVLAGLRFTSRVDILDVFVFPLFFVATLYHARMYYRVRSADKEEVRS